MLNITRDIKKDVPMTIDKTCHPLSTFPFLSEQGEKPLRLRAWKDETFRQELIANPKGVTQWLFPECFPNGKVPEQMTSKVIDEDQYTPRIILPALPDELLAPEVPKSAFISSFLH